MNKIIDEIKGVKKEAIPYWIVIKFILRTIAVIAVAIVSFNLIDSPSTINVIVGVCGIGVDLTYVVLRVKKLVMKIEQETEDAKEDEAKSK